MRPSCKSIRALLVVVLSSLAPAQRPSSQPDPPLDRKVEGQTIISYELPAAELTFSNDFRYLGGQVVNLYGNAEAEQHVFVVAGNSGPVQRFYWVQFEHMLPGNQMTYDYKPDRKTDIGGLSFIYDVKSFSDYSAVETDDPRSDSFAVSKLLAKNGLAFPRKTVRVRMFHLPTADRRSELMIIYGESLAEDSKIPTSADGVHLDDASPEAAKLALDHARAGMTIRVRGSRVEGNTFVSPENPKIRATVDKEFTYVGSVPFAFDQVSGRRFVFVRATGDKQVQRMFVIQQEAFAPSSNDIYVYRITSPVKLGSSEYQHSVIIDDNDATADAEPGKEADVTRRFLALHGYTLNPGLIMSRFARPADASRKHEIIFFCFADLASYGHKLSDFPEGSSSPEKDQIKRKMDEDCRAMFSITD
ncbi:MAG TPA: hypothetical protein VF753_01820 [Terriglobales bacterium]